MELKRLRTRYSKLNKRKANFESQAFLDELVNEALENPYNFSTIDEAINFLTQKYKLALDEIKYIKKEAYKNKKFFMKR